MRLLAELSPRDGSAWDRLGTRVLPLVEHRLSSRVFAERSVPAGSRWNRGSPRLALRAARWAAARLARRLEVVSTDVRACYVSMRPEAVDVALRRVGADREDAALAADMIEGWGSEGWPGLPVGPPASAAVANAVLLGVDRALSAAPFLRWVDDYLLPVRLLARLDEALVRAGLERSVEKTVEGVAGVWAGRDDTYGRSAGGSVRADTVAGIR